MAAAAEYCAGDVVLYRLGGQTQVGSDIAHAELSGPVQQKDLPASWRQLADGLQQLRIFLLSRCDLAGRRPLPGQVFGQTRLAMPMAPALLSAAAVDAEVDDDLTDIGDGMAYWHIAGDGAVTGGGQAQPGFLHDLVGEVGASGMAQGKPVQFAIAPGQQVGAAAMGGAVSWPEGWEWRIHANENDLQMQTFLQSQSRGTVKVTCIAVLRPSFAANQSWVHEAGLLGSGA